MIFAISQAKPKASSVLAQFCGISRRCGSISCVRPGFGKGEQGVRGVLYGGDKLIQALENGRSRKLIDRVPTVRGGFILCGRVASCHSPDCFPCCVKTRCTSSCSMARVSLQALNPKALSSA